MGFRTQAQVDKLKLPPGKAEHWEFDEGCTGLSVRIQGKARTWVVWYSVNGRRRRMKLGEVGDAMSLKEARHKAGGIVNGARDGADPLADRAATRAKAAETFGALVSSYLARGAKPRQRPRTYAETERYLDRYCADLHERPVDLTRRDIAGKLEAIRDAHGPGAARKARIYLSGCFSWAMRRGLVDVNPVIGTEAEPERPRDRVLSVAELRDVWQACAGAGDFGVVVKLLMLTGQRRAEVAALAWPEIEIDKALWTLPAVRSKNGRQHEVPISTQALALIEAQRKEEDRAKRPYLFGRGGLTPFSGYSRAKARLDDQIASLRAERRLGRKLRKGEAPQPGDFLEAWTLHDLRRSTVTHMAELGIDPHVIEAVINHVSGHKGGVAGIYNKATYRPQKAAALQRWADWFEAKVEGREPISNVVALGGTA
jgi:integrase